MFGWFDKGLCPIGIDIGTHAVHMLQLRRKAEGLALQAACRIELGSLDAAASPMERAAAAVRHGLSAQGFVGRNVAVSLPAGSVHAKSVRLPQMPDADLSQALQWEAKDRFGFDVGEGRLEWFRAGEVRRGTEVKDEVMLFAVEGAVLARAIDALSAAGLNIVAIDLAPCAAHRAMRRVAGEAGGGAGTAGSGALLDLGHSGAQFMITRDDELAFYKHIDIGGNVISDAIAGKLGISALEAAQMRARLGGGGADAADEAPLNQALRDAMRGPLEELAREIDMCLRYYVVTFRGARPDAITLAGRQAGCPEVRETLTTALGLQAEEAQPLRGVLELGDAARPDRAGEWAIATGLSLYPPEPVEAVRVEAAA